MIKKRKILIRRDGIEMLKGKIAEIFISHPNRVSPLREPKRPNQLRPNPHLPVRRRKHKKKRKNYRRKKKKKRRKRPPRGKKHKN